MAPWNGPNYAWNHDIICAFRYSLSNAELNQLIRHLPDILVKDRSTRVPVEALWCPYPAYVPCSPVEIFRTYDGRCNNFRKPLWGASHQPLARFLPPHYADGIWLVKDVAVMAGMNKTDQLWCKVVWPVWRNGTVFTHHTKGREFVFSAGSLPGNNSLGQAARMHVYMPLSLCRWAVTFFSWEGNRRPGGK